MNRRSTATQKQDPLIAAAKAAVRTGRVPRWWVAQALKPSPFEEMMRKAEEARDKKKSLAIARALAAPYRTRTGGGLK